MTKKLQGATRFLVPVLVLVALAATGDWIWTKLFRFSATTVIMTAVVTSGDVEETVLATGIVKPVRLVAVGAQVSGRVTALKVSLGQKVAKGDLIAEIDSLTQENSLRTAQASLADIQAQRVEKEASLTRNQQTLARQKTTFAQKAASQADLQSAEADVGIVLAQIAALEAQIIKAQVALDTAQVNLAYTRIIAPIDGTVLATVSQEGQTVNATQSAPTIVILGQLEVMNVRAEISEADVIKVKPNQAAYFTIVGDPDHRYETTLASIEPAPESITSDSSLNSSSSSDSSSSTTSSTSSSAIYYNGIFNVPNASGRLKTYMTAEVHIVLGEAKGVLTVPTGALGTRGNDGSYTVRVVDQSGQISGRQIKVGLNNKVTAEVLSGLKEGEKVVTGEVSSQTITLPSGGPEGPLGMGF